MFSLKANALTYQGGRYEPSSPANLKNSMSQGNIYWNVVWSNDFFSAPNPRPSRHEAIAPTSQFVLPKQFFLVSWSLRCVTATADNQVSSETENIRRKKIGASFPENETLGFVSGKSRRYSNLSVTEALNTTLS